MHNISIANQRDDEERDVTETEPEKEEIIIIAPREDDVSISIESDKDYEITYVDKAFLIDGHLHIESLNCTPLQLQWATTALKTSLIDTYGDDRDSLNKSLTSFPGSWIAKDFARVGRYRTDQVGKILLSAMEHDEIRATIGWIENLNRRLSDYEKQVKKKNANLNDFFGTSKASEYYKHRRPFHMCIGHPMDLSYAHYWGLHHLPMYLPAAGDDSENIFYFINDFGKILRKTDGRGRLTGYKLAHQFDPLEQRFWESPTVLPLCMSFPMGEQYESFKSYYQNNRTGPKDFRVGFGFQEIKDIILSDDLADKSSEEAKSLTAERLNELFQTKLDPVFGLPGATSKYFHFMDPVPNETLESFEDYAEQSSYYAATAFRYPLRFLPFYHFDPRRHYSSDRKKNIIDTVMDNHEYLSIKDNNESTFYSLQGYKNIPTIRVMENYDESCFRKYFFNEAQAAENTWVASDDYTMLPVMRDIEEAMWNLLPTKETAKKGQPNPVLKIPPQLFWGVKMYPPLGYSPYLYKEAPERYNLEENTYKHYETFFQFCSDSQIPITAHGSPRGMSMGDGFNYIINDQRAKKRTNKGTGMANNWWGFLKPEDDAEYSVSDCANYVDFTNTHTLAWKKVIGDFSQLRFCFAHYGSGDTWEIDFDDSESEATMLSQAPSARKKFLQDKKAENIKLKDWRKMITETITLDNHIFTDISCYILPSADPDEYIGHAKSGARTRALKRSKIGDNLIKAMDSNSAMFHKIIMGSDWYMTELEYSGTGEYYKGMFLMLKYMSEKKKYDGKSCDLWHQFSVINPLRFLGLIPDDPTKVETDPATGDTFYKLKTEKIRKYVNNLKAVMDDSYWEWRFFAKINKRNDIDQTNKARRLDLLLDEYAEDKIIRIYTSDVVMKNTFGK